MLPYSNRITSLHKTKGWSFVSLAQHVVRTILLMVVATAILGWIVGHTAVMYADGLRYVAQAQALERGDWQVGLSKATDHPAFATAIVLVHRVLGGSNPQDWQFAAQIAAAISGILLVIPLYLLTMEMWGGTTASRACLLVFFPPVIGHVLADVLSEGTFLLFWTWGAWSVARFLRNGATRWLLVVLAFTGLAYLTRPEGLLLPIALIATLWLSAFLPRVRLDRNRWVLAMGLLLVGPIAILGPYVALKGGIATKPAVARLLGTAPRSPAMAIERERPLAPDQSTSVTYIHGVRAMLRAVIGAVTVPLSVLAIVGIFALRGQVERPRTALFLGVLVTIWCAALVRLHVTGGYCTPRHALIAALPLIAAAARGMEVAAGGVVRILAKAVPSQNFRISTAHGVALTMMLCSLAIYLGPKTLSPLNRSYEGYRQAGEWLRLHTTPEERVFDLKGWALFYGTRQGYDFGRISEGLNDPSLSWLVAHDAFLIGPWHYCQEIRKLVGPRKPFVSFPPEPVPGVAQVHVFALSTDVARSSAHGTIGR